MSFSIEPVFFEDEEQEEYAEIPAETGVEKITDIFVEKLEGMINVDKAIKKVRNGSIVMLKIKQLREDNLDELKQCISKIKTAAANYGGDIAGAGDEEWLILTPAGAKIVRGN